MSLNQRLAAYLRAREGQWLDGRELSRVAGAYAWRSRVSELRRPPYSLTIENRVRRVRDEGGTVARDDARGFAVSEYRLVPHAAE